MFQNPKKANEPQKTQISQGTPSPAGQQEVKPFFKEYITRGCGVWRKREKIASESLWNSLGSQTSCWFPLEKEWLSVSLVFGSNSNMIVEWMNSDVPCLLLGLFLSKMLLSWKGLWKRKSWRIMSKYSSQSSRSVGIKGKESAIITWSPSKSMKSTFLFSS